MYFLRYLALVMASVSAILVVMLAVFVGPSARAQDAEGVVPNLGLASPDPGELMITWDPVSPPPTDYRISWALKDGEFVTWTDPSGNVFPPGEVTTHTLTGLTEGAEYKVAMRARYFPDDADQRRWSGPWAHAGPFTVSAAPDPTPEPTADPTPEPTAEPTPEPNGPRDAEPKGDPGNENGQGENDDDEPSTEPVLLSSRGMNVEDHSYGGPIPHVGDRSGNAPGLRNGQTDPWEFRIPDGPWVTVTGLLHAGTLSPLYWIVGKTSDQDYSMLLRIAGRDFPMSEATFLEGSKRGQIYYWKDHGLSWQVGDTVAVEVYHLPGAPAVELPSTKAAEAVRDLEMTSTEGGFLDLSWLDPENADESGVDAYEVYVRETGEEWSEARRFVRPRISGHGSSESGSQGDSNSGGSDQQTSTKGRKAGPQKQRNRHCHMGQPAGNQRR